MIYFIQMESGPIKIGYTTSISKRLSSIRTSTHETISFLGSMAGNRSVEKDLHGRFHEDNIKGEWFSPSESLFSYIKENTTLSYGDDAADYLFEEAATTLKNLGENIKIARLRRNLPLRDLAKRSKVGVNTIMRIERGDPTVSIGNYVNVLREFGLQDDFSTIALGDAVGRKLQDEELRKRASGKS